jgi:hypothetical protein
MASRGVFLISSRNRARIAAHHCGQIGIPRLQHHGACHRRPLSQDYCGVCKVARAPLSCISLIDGPRPLVDPGAYPPPSAPGIMPVVPSGMICTDTGGDDSERKTTSTTRKPDCRADRSYPSIRVLAGVVDAEVVASPLQVACAHVRSVCGGKEQGTEIKRCQSSR